MDKIAKDLEDAARWHNIKKLWHLNTLRKSSQSRPVPVKDGSGPTISDREVVKERWEEHFEFVLKKRDVGKETEENE